MQGELTTDPGRPWRRLAWLVPILALSGCVTMATIQPQPICNFDAMMAPAPSPPAPAGVAAAPAPVPAAPASPLIEAPLNSVNITDFAITNKIMVQSTSVRRSPSGTVEVWARLINCTDFPLQVEGRTHFLDEARAPAETATAWSRVFLPPRAYGVYTESSTNVSRVRYYYVELREGR